MGMTLEVHGVEKVKLLIDNVKDVNDVVNLASKAPKELLVRGVEDNFHIVRASSILGLYSLDLSKPVEMLIKSEDKDNEVVKEIISKYGVREKA